MQRGCHFRVGGSDIFECRFRSFDYNDAPDVSRKKNIVAHDIQNKEKFAKQEEERRMRRTKRCEITATSNILLTSPTAIA
jgi:hypothetical protein